MAHPRPLGWEQFSDSRKQSLEAGISFAKRAGLFGVVSESHVRPLCPRMAHVLNQAQAIVAAPILIRQAHDAGLYLLSYGGLKYVPNLVVPHFSSINAALHSLSRPSSNVPAHVKLQVENGIDAIITDELERTPPSIRPL